MITDEQAKLGQEVAKTTGKGIDLVQKVGSFVAKIGGEAFIGLGGIFNDRVQLWRYENLLAIYDRVEAIRQERKLQGKVTPIQPRALIPLLECASKEDDKTLQDLWATLIANATDADKGIELTKQFVEILSALEPLDARILMKIGADAVKSKNKHYRIGLYEIVPTIISGNDQALISLSNLIRVGCIKEYTQYLTQSPNSDFYNPWDTGEALKSMNPKTRIDYEITSLGYALFVACSK